MQDAWVWDMYRPARFVKNVRVVTFKDVNVEELAKSDLQLPTLSRSRTRASPDAAHPGHGGASKQPAADSPAPFSTA